MNKQDLIEALNQADIMLRPAAIVVNRKTAECIRKEIPDFEKYTRRFPEIVNVLKQMQEGKG